MIILPRDSAEELSSALRRIFSEGLIITMVRLPTGYVAFKLEPQSDGSKKLKPGASGQAPWEDLPVTLGEALDAIKAHKEGFG